MPILSKFPYRQQSEAGAKRPTLAGYQTDIGRRLDAALADTFPASDPVSMFMPPPKLAPPMKERP